MKRLVFIVEGTSEVNFIHRRVIPYLHNFGISNAHAQGITTNRKKNKKGGVKSYGLFKNEISNTLAQGNVVVTTLIDFFGLPTNFPGHSKNPSKICAIEEGILADFNHDSNLIPYIQKHEFEALMFSSMDGFTLLLDDPKKINQIEKIKDEFPNPEDINNSAETAPSKRCNKIFLPYNKVNDSDLILGEIEIDTIRENCPRFDKWLAILINKMNE